VRTALPFQVVESVNERAQKQCLTLDLLFARQEAEWHNHLIRGDKRSYAKGVEE
jgi:hypothetical protein